MAGESDHTTIDHTEEAWFIAIGVVLAICVFGMSYLLYYKCIKEPRQERAANPQTRKRAANLQTQTERDADEVARLARVQRHGEDLMRWAQMVGHSAPGELTRSLLDSEGGTGNGSIVIGMPAPGGGGAAAGQEPPV